MRIASETPGTILNTPTFCVIGILEEEEKKKGPEKVIEEIIVENFSKWERKYSINSKEYSESYTG